jgi:hypothetical protein
MNPFIIVEQNAKLRQCFLSVELFKSIDGENAHVRAVVIEFPVTRTNQMELTRADHNYVRYLEAIVALSK